MPDSPLMMLTLLRIPTGLGAAGAAGGGGVCVGVVFGGWVAGGGVNLEETLKVPQGVLLMNQIIYSKGGLGFSHFIHLVLSHCIVSVMKTTSQGLLDHTGN